jgi:regulator of replication initiation timing
VTETQRVSKNYDEELAKLRKQLEDVLRDNARLQMERNSTDNENKQLQQRYLEKTEISTSVFQTSTLI